MKPSSLLAITWAIILIGLGVVNVFIVKSSLWAVVSFCLAIIDLGAYFLMEKLGTNKKVEKQNVA